VEGPLDLLAPRLWGRTVVDLDALLGPVGPLDGGFELLAEVAQGVLVLGEDQDAGVVPLGRRAAAARLAGAGKTGTLGLANPVEQAARPGVGQGACFLRDAGHLV